MHPIVTGPRLQTNVAPRRDIVDLIQDRVQFSLYIQALQTLTARSQDDPLSWFGIGGIHALPEVPWADAPPVLDALKKPSYFYCAHSTVLFPVWHRAYVSLFEQALQGCAREIAARYQNNRDAWTRAANDLRSPYWDWATNHLPPPEVTELKTVEIFTPESEDALVSVPNPLLSYRYHPKPDFEVATETARHPMKPRDDAKSLKALKEDLLAGALNIRKDTHDMLLRTKNWEQFSNTSTSKESYAVANSLEQIHNGMHDRIGGCGQMGAKDAAAYDPIFWLHHTNVDRLFSLWQTIHPQEWVPESHLDIDLLPFWNTPTSFFRATSSALRDWTELNFTYPEFVGIHPKDDMRSAIVKIVDEMYGEETHPSDNEKSLTSAKSTLTRSLAPIRIPLFAKDQSHSDWILRIRTRKYALRMSYSILIFCGAPPTSVANWRTSPALVGTHSEFVNSQPERCPNCVDHLNVLSEGFINLTKLVEQKGLNDADVEKYLRANLAWRVQKIDGVVIPASALKDLEMAVVKVPLLYPNMIEARANAEWNAFDLLNGLGSKDSRWARILKDFGCLSL
ncbi:Di-copper centre-containing protein [Hymenopellis radicata]|nr:Di-copper centre-containing protein [Hymenopellis radicata]